YEMLTGGHAFRGDTAAEVLASVLVREPDFTLLPQNLNPRVQELLQRCLQKNPKRRWQAVGNLRLELEIIASSPRVAAAPAGPVEHGRALWKRAMPVLVTASVVPAFTAIVTWNLKQVNRPAVMRFTLVLPEDQQITNNRRTAVALSPDGTRLVYLANQQLFLRSMAETDTRPIAQANDTGPFFSPDGEWIGFFSFQDSTLKKIAVSGGAALTLCKVTGAQLYGASWDGDVIVFGQIDKGIMKVSAKGGEPEVVASAKPGEVMYGPQLINGGRSVLFTTTTESGPERWDNAQIVVQSLSSSERKVVIRGGSDARYL